MTRIPMPSPTGYNAENLFVSSALAHDAAGLDPRESRSGPEGGSFRNVDPDTGGWKRRRDDDALKDRSRRRRARDQGPDDDLADAVSEMQGHLNDNIADPGALTRAHQLLERLLAFCDNGESEAEDEPDNDLDRPNSSGANMAPSGNRMAGDRRFRSSPTAADFAGGGIGLDQRWPAPVVDRRAHVRAEADFMKRFPDAKKPRQM